MRRIALVGTASSGSAAPYHDPSWEIWGVSARASYVTRADRWFELHRLDGEPEDWAALWRTEMKAKVTHDCTLYMLYPEPDLGPRVVSYPHDHIVARFGTYFMTSTFAWMMAMAIDELRPQNGEPVPGEIGIWGVEMEYGTEYRQQRAGFRHFIEIAKFAGIAVTRLARGGLSYEPVPYPLWQDDPILNKNQFRRDQTKEKLDSFDASLRMTRTMIAQNRAAMDEATRSQETGYDASARIAALTKETDALMQTSNKLSRDILQCQGGYEEQCWLDDYLQP